MSPRIVHAILLAGKCSIVFGSIYLVALVFSAFTVTGDGSAPSITKFLWAGADIAKRQLGLELSPLPIVMSWSLAVFVAVFVVGLAFYRAPVASDQISRKAPSRSAAVWVLIIVAAAVFNVLASRWSKQAEEARRELVLEFVRSNAQVVEQAGDVSRLSLMLVARGDSDHPRYEVAVWSKPPLYAIVDGYTGETPPRFELVCTTRLYHGHRDTRKDACAQ